MHQSLTFFFLFYKAVCLYTIYLPISKCRKSNAENNIGNSVFNRK